MLELIYTSVPRGIRGGAGYTTVAHTDGMPTHVLQTLEGLSTYQHIDKHPDSYANNPSGFSHLISGSGAGRLHVVSRIAACAPDYSGRTNFVAHHLAMTVQDAQSLQVGPAALVMIDELFRKAWIDRPALLPARPLPHPDTSSHAPGIPSNLDAGWPPFIAQRVRTGAKTTFLVYPQDWDIRALLDGVFKLLSPAERWSTTFATYATPSFPGPAYGCHVRGVIAGTDYAANVASRFGSDCFLLAGKPSALQASAPSRPTDTITRVVRPAARVRALGQTAEGASPLHPSEIDIAVDLRSANAASHREAPVARRGSRRLLIGLTGGIIAALCLLVTALTVYRQKKPVDTAMAAMDDSQRLPVPQTPVPQTPVPQTPVPQTPVPQTPAPQTPAPQTPAPQTPAPQTELALRNLQEIEADWMAAAAMKVRLTTGSCATPPTVELDDGVQSPVFGLINYSRHIPGNSLPNRSSTIKLGTFQTADQNKQIAKLEWTNGAVSLVIENKDFAQKLKMLLGYTPLRLKSGTFEVPFKCIQPIQEKMAFFNKTEKDHVFKLFQDEEAGKRLATALTSSTNVKPCLTIKGPKWTTVPPSTLSSYCKVAKSENIVAFRSADDTVDLVFEIKKSDADTTRISRSFASVELAAELSLGHLKLSKNDGRWLLKELRDAEDLKSKLEEKKSDESTRVITAGEPEKANASSPESESLKAHTEKLERALKSLKEVITFFEENKDGTWVPFPVKISVGFNGDSAPESKSIVIVDSLEMPEPEPNE